MDADYAAAKKAEEEAIASYEGLMTAKKKEVEALSAAIEKKLERQGQVAVEIAKLKNDIGDTAEALAADKKFLKELEEGCGKKEGEWAERQKTRAEELVALADTIKVLNDDDALDLFKKTLPSPDTSLLQLQEANSAVRAKALKNIKSAQKSAGSSDNAGLAMLVLALKGK